MTLLRSVYDAGCTHFDTAEIYRSGNPFAPDADTIYNETVVGKFLCTLPRDSFTIATKCMPLLSFYNNEYDLKTMEASLDASLARLGLTYVDLYYCHRMPKTLEKLTQWMTSVKALVLKGKVKYIGLSEAGPAFLRAAHAIHPIACVQQEWSLATRNIEDSLVPVCAELNIGIVAYSPLARNLLANTEGKVPTDWRASNPRFKAENFERNKSLALQITELGASKGASAAQLSLAWLYHRAAQLGVNVVPIPGTTKVGNALSNIASIGLTLDNVDMTALEELGASVVGARADSSYTSVTFESQL